MFVGLLLLHLVPAPAQHGHDEPGLHLHPEAGLPPAGEDAEAEAPSCGRDLLPGPHAALRSLQSARPRCQGLVIIISFKILSDKDKKS